MNAKTFFKIAISAIFYLSSYNLPGQISDDAYSHTTITYVRTPGDELIKFGKTFYVGFTLEVLGIGTYVIAQYGLEGVNENTITTLSIVGGVVAGVGCITQIVSFGSIIRAGRLLNEQQKTKDNKVSFNIEPTKNGIGIVCHF